MKKNLFPILALGALTFGLASCSSEEPAVNGPVDSEGIGYMSFTISTDASARSRAEEEGDETVSGEIFNNGDAGEYAICPNNLANAALFFDKNGTFYGMSNLQAFNNTGLNHSGSHLDGYPEQFYTYITRWRNTNAEAVPTQVIVVLNANPDVLDEIAQSNKSLADVKAMNFATFTGKSYTYGHYTYNNTDYFTMTNSSFIENDEDVTVTQIAANQVCETAEQALENPVTVYVERLLAKYQLYFGEDNEELLNGNSRIIMSPKTNDTEGSFEGKVNYVESYLGTETNLDYPKYKVIGWHAYIANWAINGLEMNGNLLKDISGNAAYGFTWNFPTYHRSYWGETPDYSKTTGFTTQYRDASLDPLPDSNFFGNPTWKPGEHGQLNTLHYISYNDMKNRARYKYTAARTYDAAEGLKGYGPYRYASHYLIGAQLILEGVDENYETAAIQDNGQLEDIKDKYYAYNFFWADKASYIRYAYRRMATMVADGRVHNMTIVGEGTELKLVDEGTFYTDNAGTKLAVKDAADYFTTAPAQTIHGDGKIVLALGDEDVYVKAYKKNDEGEYTTDTEYVKLDEEMATNIIYSFAEPARHYANGAMYYAIPIQHKKGVSNGEMATINKDSGEYDLGQFGTVRNHWYRLTISAINSIGTPVDDPEQPIIPDPEDEYYVALDIVILPWHVIDNGNTPL